MDAAGRQPPLRQHLDKAPRSQIVGHRMVRAVARELAGFVWAIGREARLYGLRVSEVAERFFFGLTQQS